VATERHRFPERPAERVEQGQVDAAPGGRLGDLGADPVARCPAVAFLEERDEVCKRLERPPEQRRQDGVPEQGEGSLAALAGDIGPRERLPQPSAPLSSPTRRNRLSEVVLAAAACRNATLKGRSTANSWSSLTVGI
jgi:hypothetical protein